MPSKRKIHHINDENLHCDKTSISNLGKTCSSRFVYFLNVENKYFKFHDVPGDGNCYYHSILMYSKFFNSYKNVKNLRYFINYSVLSMINCDEILIKIFRFFHVDVKLWSEEILIMNKWATQIDMLLLSYITKVNVISVGNYDHGFVMNNMQLLLNQILRNYEIDISVNGTIHVYFHKYGSPLDKVTNGNHFGYLEPINSRQITLNCNTIEQTSIDSNIGVPDDTWTDNDMKELYVCYCLAKL